MTWMKVGINGIELYWETHGEGEPLLWLHGGMGFGADWRHLFLVSSVRARHRRAPPSSADPAREGDRSERRRHRAAPHGPDRARGDPGGRGARNGHGSHIGVQRAA